MRDVTPTVKHRCEAHISGKILLLTNSQRQQHEQEQEQEQEQEKEEVEQQKQHQDNPQPSDSEIIKPPLATCVSTTCQYKRPFPWRH